MWSGRFPDKHNSTPTQVQTTIFKTPLKIKLVLLFTCSLDTKNITVHLKVAESIISSWHFPFQGVSAAQLELDEVSRLSPLTRRQQIPFGFAGCGSLLRTRLVGLTHCSCPVFDAFKNTPKYQKPFTAQQKRHLRARCLISSASNSPLYAALFPRTRTVCYSPPSSLLSNVFS